MQLPAEFQKQSQMPSQMATSANSSKSQKKRSRGGGRGRISRRRSNATSVFDGTAISGYVREVC